MSDLKSDYRNIEKEVENWPQKPEKMGMSGNQFYRLVMDLREAVRDRSLAESLEPTLYEVRLNKLLYFVFDLQSALNYYPMHIPEEKKDSQRVWYHRADYQITGSGKKDDEPMIWREMLLSAAVTYLATPWLQHDQVDWIFIDSLIFAEISAYGESILSGQALGNPNWAYVFTGGDTDKALWCHVKKALGLFALRYVFPPAIILLLYYIRYESASFIIGAAYAVYLLVHVALWPFRYRKRRKEQKTVQEHTDRLQKMVSAYYYCKSPIVSLSTLRAYLNKAAEGGAIFDGALFSILKRVEGNRGEAFMPFAESEGI
jgi:hypothetical protein